jgi:1,4-dihydroxy-2-naphthoate octaprenyltransferase
MLSPSPASPGSGVEARPQMPGTDSAPPQTSSRLLAFIRLGRFQFLAGGFVLYGVGAAIAALGRPFDLHAYLWGQAAITATQLMTHYANDYFDLEADRANATPTRWSGGSRVLVAGELSPQVAWRTAVVLGILALNLDLLIAARIAPSQLALPILLAALVLAWEYSAPPLRLHSRGVGAPTVALVVGVLTPLAGYAMQGGPVALLPFLAVLPLALAELGMILIIDFPDAEGDRVAGKRTPAVRFGGAAAARLCVAVVSTPYLALAPLVFGGLPTRVAAAIAATSPLGIALIHALLRGDWEAPARWGRLAFLAVAWFAAVGAAELLAFTSLAIGG